MIIAKARAACNQDALDPDGASAKMQIAVWCEVLEEIPSRYLNECYKQAIKAHTTSFPLGVGEIAGVWHENCEMWLNKEQTPNALTEDYCCQCSGTGFEIIEGKGARPCPMCNGVRLANW